MSDELVALVERLVSYDSAEPDGVLEAAGFIEGWLDSRGIDVESDEVRVGRSALQHPGDRRTQPDERDRRA